MNHHKIKEHLRVNGQVFKYLFQSVTDDQARWKPGKDRWSILEVINHLYDMVSGKAEFGNEKRLLQNI